MEIIATISDAIALFLLWLFVTAGFNKIIPANGLYYSELISNFGWGNTRIAGVIAKLIGSIEIAVGLLILIPASRSVSIVLAIGLLFGYLTHMTYQLIQGRRDLDCGCGGPAAKLKMSGHLLLRNVVLIALALLCLKEGSSVQLTFWLLSGVIAIVGILVYQSCEQLISNAQKLKNLRTL